jgi:hypothetical protein
MPQPTHPWLKQRVHLAYLPGPTSPLLEQVANELLHAFQQLGHDIQDQPANATDMILTTARYGEPVPWRDAPLFNARRHYHMNHTATIYTLVHITRAEFKSTLSQLSSALAKQPIDESDFRFPGLSEGAHHILVEQGRRAGAILSLQRLVQAQAKSIRVLLLVGDEYPLGVYHFDLAGAYPYSDASQLTAFYEDIVLRILTTLSTHDISQHTAVGEMVPRPLWQQLSTPAAMLSAGAKFGERNFFTEMVRIADLVQIPAIGEAVAAQYSEGCYATWEPRLNGLIATVTGRARPVSKDAITEDDLAVIVGVREDRNGALVRLVEGSRNLAASSEAVEMMEIDSVLPVVRLDLPWDIVSPVPVVRSKVHGHRSIAAYDPRLVEYVPLAPQFQHYLVSCGSEAQAQGIREAFAHSAALQQPQDPRQLVFTVLPGHGAVIAEKWAAGKTPFQLIWEYMDAGYLRVGSQLPQGAVRYIQAAGLMELDPACLSDINGSE